MAHFNKNTILYLAVLTGSAFGAPKATTSVGTSQHTDAPTPQTTVLSPAAVTRPPEAVRVPRSREHLRKRIYEEPPEYLTIEITNSYGQEITTAHASNVGVPTPVGGPILAGEIPDGATVSFAVPTGWAGNVALNRANMSINGDVSLIEASFAVPPGPNFAFAVAGVDVSHVNGFTVPITCECDGEWVSGCNKDLFDYSSSDDGDDYADDELQARDGQSAANAALNPLRDDMGATSADEFFKPCQGLAYTFPNDHEAMSMGACQSGTISCCVGTVCGESDHEDSNSTDYEEPEDEDYEESKETEE